MVEPREEGSSFDPDTVYHQDLQATNLKTTTTKTMTVTRQVKVKDEFGNPIAKAHVYFSENNGTTTNSNGMAFLSGDPNQTVTISYVGYGTKKFSLKDLPPAVTLKMEANNMDEVVVTGNKPESKTPKYLWPAIGGLALVLILMSAGNSPKEVTL